MAGVAGCVSAFFVDRRRRHDAEDNNANPDGDSDERRRGNLFAAAALDLLMVLHARLPFGNSNNNYNSGSGGGSEGAVCRGTHANGRAGSVSAEATAEAAAAEAALVGASDEQLSSAAGASRRSLPVEATVSADVVDSGGGGGGESKGAGAGSGRRVGGGQDAWMVILRALSRGATSGQREVAMHALQLLTKVCLEKPRGLLVAF